MTTATLLPQPNWLKCKPKRSRRIRQHVAGLIPSTDASAGASPAVTVTPFSTLSAPEPPPQSFSSRAIAWLTEAWSTLAALAVALVGLVMLRTDGTRRLERAC